MALAKVRNGGTAQDRVDYLTLLNPQQSDAARQAFEQMDKAQQQAALEDAGKGVAVFKSGDKALALGWLDGQIEAAKNAGNVQSADMLSKLRQAADINPAVAENFFANSIALMPGGKDVLDSMNKNLAAPGERDLTAANAAKAWADAAKAGLGPDISSDSEKIINQATDTVTGSLLLASQADNLATAIEKAKPASGWAGQAFENWKKGTGTQDSITALKQDYVRLRNQDVLKNLPPGVASDKDIEIALKAFPDENANPEQLSGFLRGMAKLQRYTADVNKARAEWVTQNGNLGPARREFSITQGDKKAPIAKGDSFWTFTSTIPIPNVTPQPVGKGAR